MADRSTRRDQSVPTLVGELWELVVTYLKQETIVPIKGLGRFIALGVAGSVFLAIGLVFLSLAGLRALQSETGTTFAGNLSWAPYLITLVGAGAVAAAAVVAIGRGSSRD